MQFVVLKRQLIVLEGCDRFGAEIQGHAFKVRVNTIAPAVVNTPLSEDSVYRKTEEGMKHILSKHPLGLGEPEDVAKAALFLLSDASGWITGSTLTVDGGYSIT